MAAMNVNTTKRCAKCGEVRCATAFHRDKTRVDGLFCWCRDCKANDRAKRYKADSATEISRVIQWRNKNWERLKPKMLEYRHRRMAREKQAPGDHTAADVQSILKSQRHKCASCKTSLKMGYHVDHIQPLSKNGSNDKFNLQMLCARCNLVKSNKDPMTWAAENGRLL